MFKYNILIPGEPIAQQRHRHFWTDGMIRNFDPCAKDKEKFRKYILSTNPPKDFYNYPLEVHFLYASTPAKYLDSYPTKRNQSLWFQYNTHKPDCDNLAKFTLDACNGLLWKDDAQVVSLSATKIYSEKPFTKISIMIKNECEFEDNRRILLKLSPDELRGLINECDKVTDIVLEEPEGFLEGHRQTQYSAADTLVHFVRKNYPLLNKLHKEISKWTEEPKNV